MRRFQLRRLVDKSGTSGTGTVAEGVVFSDGSCVLHWLTALSSWALYRSIDELVAIHGHDGSTVVEWIDPDARVTAVQPVFPDEGWQARIGMVEVSPGRWSWPAVHPELAKRMVEPRDEDTCPCGFKSADCGPHGCLLAR